jgi:hypothetical protein
VRCHALQHAVEVVGVNLNKLAVLQGRKRLFGLSGEIAEHAHDEGKLLHFDGVSHFHVIRDLHPGSPDATKFLLSTLSGHNASGAKHEFGKPNLLQPKQKHKYGPNVQ